MQTDTTEETKTARFRLDIGSIVLLMGVVLALGTLAYALFESNRNTQPTSGAAPQFELTTFDGDRFSLEEQRGKIVVLNFWGSWCAPCRAESPELQQIHEQYQDQDVVVLGIAYRDSKGDSQAFIEELGLTYLNGHDPTNQIAEEKYHIQGAPENFVIDRNGKIARYYLGSVTADELSGVLDDLLQE